MSSKPSQGAREEILNWVRAAVAIQAPRKSLERTGPIFSPVTNLLERFQAESASNFVECVITQDQAESRTALQQILSSLPTGEVFFQDAPEVRALAAGWSGEHTFRWSSEGAPAEASQATVTLCEALVALTGSVLVSSRCGGRGASIVAPCHIVVARREQLVGDLEAALARAGEIAPDNSYVGLITGCSRTSDIEKLLVIGAHGPRRLVVIVQG